MINFWVFTWVIIPLLVLGIGVGAVALSRHDASRVDRARLEAVRAREEAQVIAQRGREEEFTATGADARLRKIPSASSNDQQDVDDIEFAAEVRRSKFIYELASYLDKSNIISNYFIDYSIIVLEEISANHTDLYQRISIGQPFTIADWKSVNDIVLKVIRKFPEKSDTGPITQDKVG